MVRIQKLSVLVIQLSDLDANINILQRVSRKKCIFVAKIVAVGSADLGDRDVVVPRRAEVGGERAMFVGRETWIAIRESESV